MTRWMLLLGSNLADDTRLHAAVEHLMALGNGAWLTSIEQHAADGHGAGMYYNALVMLDCEATRETLDAELKWIEAALGRRRDGSSEVAIDIDIVASWQDDAWRADAHALAKGEFARATLPRLLRGAHLDVAVPPSA